MRSVLRKLSPALLFLLLFTSGWAKCLFDPMNLPVTLESPTATYWLESSDDCSRWLMAEVDGVQSTVAELDPDLLYWLELIGDFDNDGVADVLVASSTGGNCCPPEYLVASAFSDAFPTIAEIPDAAWRDIEFANGVFTLQSDLWIRHYRYVGGEIVVENDVAFAWSPAEVWVDISFPTRGDAFIEPIDIDLDDKGDYTQVGCYSGRHLSCMAYQRDGAELDIVFGCNRVGFSRNRTLGYRDVICDRNLIGKWDGNGYVFTAATVICSEGATSTEALYELAGRFGAYSPEARNQMLACGRPNDYSAHGPSPLFAAVLANDAEALRALAEYGHDPNYARAEGVGPLMQAAAKAEPQTVIELLALGASPSLASTSRDPYEVLAAAARNPALTGSPAMLVLIAAIVAEQSRSSNEVPVNVSFEAGVGPQVHQTPELDTPTSHQTNLTYRLAGGGVVRELNEDETIELGYTELVLTLNAVTLSFPVVLNHRSYLLNATYVTNQDLRMTGSLADDLGIDQGDLDNFIDLQLIRKVRTPASRNMFAFSDTQADEEDLGSFGLTNVGSLMVGSTLVTNGTWTPSVGARVETAFSKYIDPGTVISLNHSETVAAASTEGFQVNGLERLRIQTLQSDSGIRTEILVEQTTEYKSDLRHSSATPMHIEGRADVRLQMLLSFDNDDAVFFDQALSGPFEVSSAAIPWTQMETALLEHHVTQLTRALLYQIY